ncbi:MAG: hypothetical protein V3W14_12140 [Candidatus Neomarinimicrobiota bacterium]
MTKALPVYLLLCLGVLMLAGCAESPDRHVDLGQWYYDKGLVDDAILEFKEAIRLSPADPRSMNRDEVDLVARAHRSLAVAYAGKQWYEMALAEARKTFEMQPTPENYELQELIRRRGNLESLPQSSGAQRP